MGKIEGVKIENFGPLKNIVMGKTLSNQKGIALGNVTAIIGPSGNGKSTLADAFGFWQIVWKLEWKPLVIRKTGVDFSKFDRKGSWNQ